MAKAPNLMNRPRRLSYLEKDIDEIDLEADKDVDEIDLGADKDTDEIDLGADKDIDEIDLEANKDIDEIDLEAIRKCLGAGKHGYIGLTAGKHENDIGYDYLMTFPWHSSLKQDNDIVDKVLSLVSRFNKSRALELVMKKEDKCLAEELEHDIDKKPCNNDSYFRLFQKVLLGTMLKYILQREEEKNQKEIAALHDYTKSLLDQFPETKAFGRGILWKVHQKREQAVICSELFYVEKLHYRAYIRMHPNGEGEGKGTHMSLSLVIKKGAFDEYLQWPFTHKVTFKLINLVGSGDIVHTFQPDPISKPEADIDESSDIGCQQFASHSDLKEQGFVEDDTLFILCEVH